MVMSASQSTLLGCWDILRAPTGPGLSRHGDPSRGGVVLGIRRGWRGQFQAVVDELCIEIGSFGNSFGRSEQGSCMEAIQRGVRP
jgi:hypothetical protein